MKDILNEFGVPEDDAIHVVSETGVPEGEESEEMPPIKAPLKALKFRTVNKRFGWWAAVVLLESYAKKQICFYLWQKGEDGWKRKQKFGIHSREDWQLMKKAVEAFVGELP